MGRCRPGFKLTKFFENRGLILRSTAYSSVLYGYADKIPDSMVINLDLPAFWRELHSIAEQVVENLLETHTIGVHRQAGSGLLLDVDVLCHCERTNGRQNLRQGFRNLKIFTTKFELPGLDLGQIQNVIDQLQQVMSTVSNMSDKTPLLIRACPTPLLPTKTRKTPPSLPPPPRLFPRHHHP